MSKVALFQALTASILLHFLTLAAMLQFSGPPALNPATPIEILYPSDKKNQQFVTDPDLKPLKEALKQLQEKADFLSRETQRVKEQVIAQKIGPTENNSDRNIKSPENSQSKSKTDRQGSSETPNTGEPDPFGTQAPQGSDTIQNVTLTESTIAEYIPQVRKGGFTSLNTDQFLYYTFYSRINEQVRNRWVMNLQGYANESGRARLQRLGQKTQVTEVEILLDKEGNFKKAIFHRRSDDPELDRAASQAFRLASPFLNPPLDIVKADGYVHLYYAFYVDWRN